MLGILLSKHGKTKTLKALLIISTFLLLGGTLLLLNS